MQASTTSDVDEFDAQADEPAPVVSGARHRRRPHLLQPHALCVVTTLVFFVADIVLPRGATPAIGYCLVAVLARTTRQRSFLLAVTGICSILTWIGFALEPAGAAWWMSVFDRAMVTGVLWLTLLLVWRRMEAEVQSAEHARALRVAVQELQRSNAELESFASVVSHDIRGPLNSIALLIKLMSSRASIQGDAECSEWTHSILSEVIRMGGLVQSLLAYGRIGAGEVKLSECNCQSAFESVRQALRAELESTGAEVTNDPLPTVRADPSLIVELFQNLIENSIKYRGSARPRIHVSAIPLAEGWRFSVRDNGVGIASRDCARVFEPFYRSGAAQSSPGAGLGLATCKRIVERHGGQIEVQSSLGFGSTVSFFIPDPSAMQNVGTAAAADATDVNGATA